MCESVSLDYTFHVKATLFEKDDAMAKILVVDDSLFARIRVRDMLSEGGYETFEAENGRHGLEQVAAGGPDLVLTDLLMPELDGVAFLAALRASGNRVPVIVLSADIQESKRQQCQDHGAAGFLAKPPQKAALLKLVGEVLGAAS